MLAEQVVYLAALGRMLVPISKKGHQPFPARWTPQVWHITGDFDYLLHGGIGGVSIRSTRSCAHAITYQ